MPNITLILSGLALLAASVSLILIIREKKRNEERNVAFERYKTNMLHYVDKKFEAMHQEAQKYADEAVRKAMMDVSKRFTDEEVGLWDTLNKEFEAINKSLTYLHKTSEQYASMEKRVEEVMQMVEKIGDDLMNDNNCFQDQLGQTLSNIMAFDPMESQRKARNRAMGMGEDD